ncbi:MAG: gfo/Idh/MocA family oxidoreductase, partial [Verrucomicrobiae bacterium]|nr:gfo/Idh/MocA family oxidoreductase [Verrucomicrobiae bacterium]
MSDSPTVPHEPANDFGRRNFMKAAGAAAFASTYAGAARGAGIDPGKKLKVGFIGTGGRGTGAAAQALTADDNVELWAVADVFQDRIDTALK